MGTLIRFNLADLVARHGVTHLIETGHGAGFSCQAALDAGFDQVLSCEIHEALFEKVVQTERLHVEHTDSVAFLETSRVKRALAAHRSLVFLDAHFPGADYDGGAYRNEAIALEKRLPLLAELELLRGKVANALIVIDDVRIYRRDFAVARGPMPDWAEDAFEKEADFLALLDAFTASHALHWLADDTGYAVLWPHAWGEYDLKTWVRPGDITQPRTLSMNVPGTTCISINRRLLDARFGNRWLVGEGIDIGGGKDSIALYGSLFPRMGAVTVYDWAQGDAQYLRNVQDGVFDFVYSAHCLEHMVDPRVALRSWLRVVRPGGHLVITVPDEDMYEQGVWPSTFNGDHKHTFTMFKRTSWSPASISVLDLLRELEHDIEIAKIERLDHGFLQHAPRFDQTRTAFSECGIEFVLKKL